MKLKSRIVKNIHFTFFIVILLILGCFSSLKSAGFTNLRIINAGKFKGLSDGRKMFLNKVHLEYVQYGVKCDTAIVNKDMTRAKLFGNVILWDRHRYITCKEAELYKKEETTSIKLRKKVTIVKDSIILSGENGFYNSNNKRLEVYTKAKLKYLPNNLQIEADDLVYDEGKNRIEAIDISNIYTFDSTYFHKINTERLTFNGNDSLLFTDEDFKTYSFEHHLKLNLPLSNKSDGAKKFDEYLINLLDIIPKDSLNTQGHSAHFYLSKNKHSYLKGDCYFAISDSLNKTTTLTCDTLLLKNSFSDFNFLGNVVFIKDSLNITSKKTFFYTDENKFRLLGDPVATFGKSKGLADSIFLWTNKEFNPKKLIFMGRAYFKQSNNHTEEANILSGRKITLNWKDKELSKMQINHEAASLYFMYNNSETDSLKTDKSLMATNFVTGDSLKVFFENNEPGSIEIFSNSSGKVFPPKYKQKAIESIKKLLKRQIIQ